MTVISERRSTISEQSSFGVHKSGSSRCLRLCNCRSRFSADFIASHAAEVGKGLRDRFFYS